MKKGKRTMRGAICLCAGVLVLASCDKGETTASDGRTTDAEVFTYLTSVEPYSGYSLFPLADSVVTGSLNGSTAHRPSVRVSLNQHAMASLVNGKLPDGSSFRDSSVVLKQIIENGSTTLMAVVFKRKDDPNAAGGWLWGEYLPDGSTFISITNKGAGCIGCHSLEQGLQNDHIRTFERQTP